MFGFFSSDNSDDSDSGEVPGKTVYHFGRIQDAAVERFGVSGGYRHPNDDNNCLTVAVVDDTPDEIREMLRKKAKTSRERVVDNSGQVSLTEREKDRIDFGKTNIFHAESVKGVAEQMGVDDWVSFYDESADIEEHVEVFAEIKRSTRTQSDDSQGTSASSSFGVGADD